MKNPELHPSPGPLGHPLPSGEGFSPENISHWVCQRSEACCPSATPIQVTFLTKIMFGHQSCCALLASPNATARSSAWRNARSFTICSAAYSVPMPAGYVKPQFRRSGIVAALVARLCSEASKTGAQFLHGGGGDGPEDLYERVAIGNPGRDCYLSGRAFQVLANLDGLPVREIIRRLPDKELGLQPSE